MILKYPVENILSHSDEIENAGEKVDYLLDIAYKCQESVELQNGLVFADRALNFSKNISDLNREYLSLVRIGYLNYKAGNYEEALNYFQQSTCIYEDEKKCARAFDGIGMVYRALKRYDKALYYKKKALKIREENKDFKGIQQSLNNISNVYNKLGDYKKSFEYIFRALKMAEELKDNKALSIIYNNIGELHRELKEYNKALNYYKKSLILSNKSNDKVNTSITLFNIGLVNKVKKNYQEALNSCLESYEIIKHLKSGSLLMNIVEAISELYEDSQDFKKALQFRKKYIKIRSKMFDEDSSKMIAEMDAKYSVSMKEKETEIYRLKNVELVEAYKQIESQKSELEIKNNELVKINQSKDSILRIVSHDLKSSIGSVIPFCQMLTMIQTQSREAEDTLKMIKSTIDRSLVLVNDILEANRIDMEGFVLDFQEIDVKLILKDYMKDFNNIALKKDIQLNYISIPDEMICSLDFNRFWQIMYNLISNAVKFSNRNEKVDITLGKHVENGKIHVFIEVKDNGVGISEKEIDIIFNKFTAARKCGTEGEPTTGLGLSIVKKLVQLHGGNISVQSEIGKGSKFTILFPLQH